MRQHLGSALQLSPIARKQQALAGFGFFGAANTSVYSGPPVGAGAGKGAETGAAQGAALGTTIMPGIGTAIGTVIGAIGGAIAGSINKVDPEQHTFDSAVAVWQQNRLGILNIANKYLPIAGLFDLSLKGPHIPIYQKYGRMGEEKFTYDLATLIYNAAQAGKITASDTPQTVMSNVVQPWIDSWGYGPMQDPHADMINLLILGMIADYVTGAAPQVWRARGGDLPASFSKIPPFALPGAGASTVSNAAYVAPGSAVAAAPVAVITTSVPAPAPPAATAPPTATAAVTTPTAVTVPAGFTIVGSANGLQAYLGPDGLYYSWSGTTMTPLTGLLTGTSGAVANVVSGQIQTPASSTAQSYPTPVYTPPTPDYSSYTTPAQQTVPVPQIAPAQSVPTWAWLGLGAGAVYLLMGRRRPA